METKERLYQHRAEVELNHKFLYLGMCGSQLYGLDTPESDVDTKALVLPSVEDIALSRPMINKTLKFDDGGQCVVKDVRDMCMIFLKQNPNFLEILFGDYQVNSLYASYFEELRAKREKIARFNPLLCTKAMMRMGKEKYERMYHVSPSTEKEIQEKGYSYKNLHHLVRLRQLQEDYIAGKPFEECLIAPHNPYLMRIKMGEIPLEEADSIAKIEVEKLKFNYDVYINEKKEEHPEVREFIYDFLIQLFKKSF